MNWSSTGPHSEGLFVCGSNRSGKRRSFPDGASTDRGQCGCWWLLSLSTLDRCLASACWPNHRDRSSRRTSMRPTKPLCWCARGAEDGRKSPHGESACDTSGFDVRQTPRCAEDRHRGAYGSPERPGRPAIPRRKSPAQVATTIEAHANPNNWPLDSYTTDTLSAEVLARQYIPARVEVTGRWRAGTLVSSTSAKRAKSRSALTG